MNTIGMPQINKMNCPDNYTEGDRRRGNPNGDQVDNTSGANPAGQSISQGRGTGKGAYLHMQSIAPNIYKQTSY